MSALTPGCCCCQQRVCHNNMTRFILFTSFHFALSHPVLTLFPAPEIHPDGLIPHQRSEAFSFTSFILFKPDTVESTQHRTLCVCFMLYYLRVVYICVWLVKDCDPVHLQMLTFILIQMCSSDR